MAKTNQPQDIKEINTTRTNHPVDSKLSYFVKKLWVPLEKKIYMACPPQSQFEWTNFQFRSFRNDLFLWTLRVSVRPHLTLNVGTKFIRHDG